MDLASAPLLDPVDVDLPDDTAPQTTRNGTTSITVNGDGSVTIEQGRSLGADSKFDDNLAEHMSENDLRLIGSELCMAIEDDDQTRSEWLTRRADGIKMLALEVDKPSAGSDDMRSQVRTTQLLEAVLRFQANASGELMPADGPVKVRNDSQDVTTAAANDLSDALEKDMNHYLTTVATEYYPDTDRMLFMLGSGGASFKKVYRCPIRRRPVSESVPAEDLIVSNAATDLANADRVTHRVKMRPRVLKRMQKVGAYRDIDVGVTPAASQPNVVDDAKTRVSGVAVSQARPEDHDFTIYECYCQYDLPGFEHEEDGEPSGIPRPYKIVIEKETQKVLEIRRNWREDDDMEQARDVFVDFCFIPGLGFYGIGLAQLIGNPNTAATALLRCSIDASVFANFPGMVHTKMTGRQETNDLRIMPGQSKGIDTNGLTSIRDAIMPLPYKPPDGTILELMKQQLEAAARVAGTAEIQVGEGRQDAPVGTTIAMIEQATKIMDAVHKRLHRSQAREFTLLRDLFRDNPDDLWRCRKVQVADWTKEMFVTALNNADFVPAADPNTASHLQRIMRAQALYMMASANPTEFNIPEVKKIVLKALGYNNPESLVATAPAGPPPNPDAAAKQMQAQASVLMAQAKQGDLQLRAQELAQKARTDDQKSQTQLGVAQIGAQSEAMQHGAELKQQQMIESAKLADTQARAQAEITSAHLKQHADHAHDLRKTALAAAVRPKAEIKPTSH